MTSPWFWGFCGAFIQAAPKFSTCLYGQPPTPCGKCILDGGFALIIGPIAAAAFSAAGADWLGLHATRDSNAIAAVIGLVANPLAPMATGALVEGITAKIRKWIG